MKYRFLSAIVIAVAVAALVACGDKTSPTTPSNTGAAATTVAAPGAPGSGTGKLTISLKDSPFSDAQAVLVTFSEVSVHSAGGAWQTVPFVNAGSRTCDLKHLQDVTDLLGVGTLDAGHYTQIRLTVSSARLYFQNAYVGEPCTEAAKVTEPVGTYADVTIPSGELKLNREFDLAANGAVTILLDFDGDKSIHETGKGKYQMQPVISIMSVTASGQ